MRNTKSGEQLKATSTLLKKHNKKPKKRIARKYSHSDIYMLIGQRASSLEGKNSNKWHFCFNFLLQPNN